MDFAHTLDSSGSSQSNSRSRSSETRCQKARSTDNYLLGKDDNRIQFNHHSVESLRINFQRNQALSRLLLVRKVKKMESNFRWPEGS
jgi:TolA-binding protein